MTIEEKIRAITSKSLSCGVTPQEEAQRIINEIIKPLTEEAFEAGEFNMVTPNENVITFEQWQKENL